VSSMRTLPRTAPMAAARPCLCTSRRSDYFWVTI
jgi:hypothetical protein